MSGENRPLTRLDPRELYRRILRRDPTKLIRRDAHFFGEVSESLAKFFYQSLNVGEMVLDGLEATGGGVCHDGIISEMGRARLSKITHSSAESRELGVRGNGR